jgi:hypothetical protein
MHQRCTLFLQTLYMELFIEVEDLNRVNGEEKSTEENPELPLVAEAIFKLMNDQFKKDKAENKHNGLVLILSRVEKVIEPFIEKGGEVKFEIVKKVPRAKSGLDLN